MSKIGQKAETLIFVFNKVLDAIWYIAKYLIPIAAILALLALCIDVKWFAAMIILLFSAIACYGVFFGVCKDV